MLFTQTGTAPFLWLPSAPAPFMGTTGGHPFNIPITICIMHLYRVSQVYHTFIFVSIFIFNMKEIYLHFRKL